MNDKTPEQIELDTLRKHNTELLADLHSVKTDRARLTSELDAMTGERNTAMTEVNRFKLGLPVAAMLEDVAIPGMLDTWHAEFNRAGYSFALDGDAVVVRDTEGNTPMVKGPKDEEPRPVRFDFNDLDLLVCGPAGVPMKDRTPSQQAFMHLTLASKASGAGGGPSYGTGTHTQTPEPKPTAPSPQFGLN